MIQEYKNSDKNINKPNLARQYSPSVYILEKDQFYQYIENRKTIQKDVLLLNSQKLFCNKSLLMKSSLFFFNIFSNNWSSNSDLCFKENNSDFD